MSAHTPVDPAKIERQKRLEETLRENLKRRKLQAKARKTGSAPADPDDAPEPDAD
ncbi:hypothetical protein [Aureimonas frigidaquae]|uniref:hypothetical protein n=1 Tax=Aureimonas frigidaquae TaxID=424757 RepID=UPI000A8BD29E|nr:hypothetical protein [Aureimonas frigidaquae]